jgi:NADP-dependent 3-hydroxy acid dehydrogenase YdfG
VARSGTQPPARAGIITGASGRYGHGIGVELARQEKQLLLVDGSIVVTDPELIEARSRGRLSALALDLANAGEVAGAVSQFAAENGGIDFLVVASEKVEEQEFINADPAEWGDLIDLNILSALYAIRAVLPIMAKAGRGQIVLIGSEAGRKSCPGAALYSATKWSITGLGHALRSETSPAGIKVATVEPPWAPHPGGNASVDPEATTSPSMEATAQAVAATVGFLLEDPRHAFMTEVLIG